MKIASPSRQRPPAKGRVQAFTLPGLVVALGVFMFLMGGIVYGYLNGMYLFQLTQLKMETTDDARKSLFKFCDSVRSANRIQVGNGNLTTFTQCSSNSQQMGNALVVYPDTNYTTVFTNTSDYTYYFFDTNTSSTNYTKLCMVTNGTNPNTGLITSSPIDLVIAHSIVPSPNIFQAEDSWTNICTSNINNRVISMNLSFYQIEYPIVNVGTGDLYNSYQLRTRVTSRVIY